MLTDVETRTAKDFAWISLTDDDRLKLSKCEGKIIECCWDDSWKTFIPKARYVPSVYVCMFIYKCTLKCTVR